MFLLICILLDMCECNRVLASRYANRAKNIKNKPKINEDPKDALLREYQEEIMRLKSSLEKRKGKGGYKRRQRTESGREGTLVYASTPLSSLTHLLHPHTPPPHIPTLIHFHPTHLHPHTLPSSHTSTLIHLHSHTAPSRVWRWEWGGKWERKSQGTTVTVGGRKTSHSPEQRTHWRSKFGHYYLLSYIFINCAGPTKDGNRGSVQTGPN